MEAYQPKVLATCIRVTSSYNFNQRLETLRHNKLAKQMLYGIDFTLQHSIQGKNVSLLPSTGLSLLPYDYWFYQKHGFYNCSPFVKNDVPITWLQKTHLESLMKLQRIKLQQIKTRNGLDPVTRLYFFLKNSQIYQQANKNGLLTRSKELQMSQSMIQIPKFNSLIADSAKLRYLNKTLVKFKKEKRRVLIFCQMTKMLDILEEYLTRKKYRYFRLDGQTNITDRRDMIYEFQNNPDIFVFLLSTRAGGLGVTLTAANTVIFYDNDWNPTMDAQATDRAHRIG